MRQRGPLLDEMDQWLRINGVPDAYRPRLQRASMAVLGLVTLAMPDWPVRGGEHLQLGDFDFEILWTPGHSPGHICLYEKARRLLVSGDHVLLHITPNVSMHSQSMGNPLADYLDALKMVEALPVEMVLPAHGEPFRDLPGRVQEIRQHHEERKRQILAALAGERKTAYQVAGIIPWNTMGVPWAELSPLTKRNAVTETLAHLELMRAGGTVNKAVEGGTVLYAAGLEG